jgi:hypothetical protein
MLRKFMLASSFAAAAFFAEAQTQLKTPQPSPTQSIRQDFGIQTVELIYSRPGIKKRKIFGDLVPFGKVWRTGANSATRIKFSDDVMIGGKPVKAGEYAIFTIPNEKEWEIIINRGSANWGTEYKQEDDIIRVKASPVKMEAPMESFTMQFANVKPASMELQIMWDKTLVSVPITADLDTKVMAQIDNLINKDNKPYFQAAMYYLDNNKDLNQAIVWFDRAIEQNPKGYWILHQKANALAKLGMKDLAKTTALKSMELAREQKNEDYVRLNEKLLNDLN